MKNIFCLFPLLLFQISIHAQIIFESPLSNRSANYHIKATLDCQRKQVKATEILQWRNPSRHPTGEFYFHLYMNAFRNERSTFLSQAPKMYKSSANLDPQELGGIDIQRFVLNNTYDLLPQIEYVQPNDSNQHDSTVVRIKAPRAIAPGEEVSFEIDFICRLPKIIARTGYSDEFFLFGQWFPKIGVYRDDRWHCHQFFPMSEFFADFGVYEVEFTLPVQYLVGSTGVLTQEILDDSLKTCHFRAEDVHDFALVAWPKFRKETRVIEGIQVHLLYAPEHSGQKERYFTALTHAIKYLNKWIAPYPYPQLTVVDPPLHAFKASGMEYPCFIMAGSVWGMPSMLRFYPEEVAIHEYAHQYFYGILASNEANEPWLDEGFTSYATLKVMNQAYGASSALSELFNIRFGRIDEHRQSYLRRPDVDIVVRPSWEYSVKSYGVSCYSKPALILQTLENLAGASVMDQVIKKYYEKWKFKHPTTHDFLMIVDSVVTQDLDWFFEQALWSTRILDYGIDSVYAEKISVLSDSISNFHNRVVVRRAGSFIFPVEVFSVLANGEILRQKWNGEDSVFVIDYNIQSPIKLAWVDTGQRVPLDVNWTNNSMTVKNNYKATIRHWLQTMKLYQQALLGLFIF